MKSIAGTLGAEKLMTAAADLEKVLLQTGPVSESQFYSFDQELILVANGLEAAFLNHP
jgi:hypothetical protein